MRFCFFLLFFLLILSVYSQPGFIKAYDLSEGGTVFHKILLVEDTLIAFGLHQDTVGSPWGIMMLKLDTLGNVLDHKVYYDDDGDSYVVEQGYEVIQTGDGGYVIVGQLLHRNNPIMLKMAASGDLEFVEEYQDSTVLNMRHWNVREIEGGYLSIGVKQQMNDFKWDAFIMKVNDSGEKIWEVSYGDYDERDSFYGISILSTNDILLTGGVSNWSGDVSSLAELYSIAKAVKIDTTGSITWEWEGELDYIGGSSTRFGQLHSCGDTAWMNIGAYSTVVNDENVLFQAELVKRDLDFNVIWNKPLLPASRTSRFIDLTQTPEDDWVVAGQYYKEVPYPLPPVAYQAGWLAKISANGDSLWSRTDTVYWDDTFGSTNYLSSLVVLESGSVVAAGYLNRYSTESIKSIGWLMKTDKNGCIELPCDLISTETDLSLLLDHFEVFPNPASNQIIVQGEGEFDALLFDSSGQKVLSIEGVNKEVILNIEALSPGIYFLKVKTGNRFLTKKVCVF